MAALSRYNRSAVLALDAQAVAIFSTGLGASPSEICHQLEFVLHRYGGLALDPQRGSPATEIAQSVHQHRDAWIDLLVGANAFHLELAEWNFAVPAPVHFECFGLLRRIGSAAQIRCLTKFIHLLRPDAFPVVDSWVGAALDVGVDHNSGKNDYSDFAQRFLDFVTNHREILLSLKSSETPPSWSDIKLVDKVLLCRRAAELRVAA